MMTNAEAGRSEGNTRRHPTAATRKAAPAANVVTISRRAKPYRSWALDCSTRESTLRSNRTRRSDRRDGFISGRIGCFKEALDRRWPRTGEASARVITHDVSVTILLVTLNRPKEGSHRVAYTSGHPHLACPCRGSPPCSLRGGHRRSGVRGVGRVMS